MCKRNETLVRMIEERLELKAQIEALSDRLDKLNDDFKADLGQRGVDKYEFTLDGKKHTISLSTFTTNRFDSKRFKEEQASLYNLYCTASEGSRLTVK